MDNLVKAKSIDLIGLVGKTVSLKKVTPREMAGPCPKCGGTDRLRVNADRGWFCRHCHPGPDGGGHWADQVDWVMFLHNTDFKGALLRLVGNTMVTSAELEQLARQRQELESQRVEEAKKAMVEARESISGLWSQYHDNLQVYERGLDAWMARGLSDRWMEYYQVGYCPERDSITIPYFRYNAPGLFSCINIRHRLLADNAPGGKYRPECVGLGNHLFTPWYEEPIYGDVLLVEGEIKAMVTFAAMWINEESPMMQVVGIPGKSWKEEWITELQQASRLLICLDPDAKVDAERLHSKVQNSRIINLPGKIDDLITAGAMDGQTLLRIIKEA